MVNVMKKYYDCELKDGSIILNPDGDFEVTEFFDYNCVHCKAESKIIKQLMEVGKSVRLIIKPIPILGKISSYATQIGYGIIMSEPDKFVPYIRSIMNNFNDDGNQIKIALQEADIDIQKLKAKLVAEKENIIEMIKVNLNLAKELGITGAPAFLINGKLRIGELSLEDFNVELDKFKNSKA